MKLWVDDIREAPDGYIWCHSVSEIKAFFHWYKVTQDGRSWFPTIEEVNLDHDAGDYASMGGDYIEILNWLEGHAHEDNWDLSDVTFKFHTMNCVGDRNMRRICEKNGWNLQR